MKETINVNIGGQAFTMDLDAYQKLTAYLDDVAQRLPEEDNETYADIETRVAEIFREKVPSPMMVITISTVESTIQQIGSPETFGKTSRKAESDATDDQTETEEHTSTSKRLYRSRSYRAIGGVCGGIAEHMDWDVSMVRIAAILLIFFAGGSLWLYIILWIVLPEEPVKEINLHKEVKPKK